MNSIISDGQLQTILNLFSDLGLCKKEDNVSNDIDSYYQFNNIKDKELEVTKTFFQIIPENWSVKYYESELEDGENSIDLIRYFTIEEKELYMLGEHD